MLGGGSGGGFQATTSGAGQEQQDTAYQQTQAGIKQQQDFVNALNLQGGLGNQASVFNQQQGLANQLQNVANGTGPNPAQAQLAQNTAANTANQAALMAGQRGSSQNTGMIARQAAQQGAQNQQNAVGQAATLSAQQQLAGMQQLQNQQSSMGNLANTQVGQQQAGLQNLNQMSLNQQANLLGAQANQNTTNAGIQGGNQAGQQNLIGSLMGGAGMAMMAAGGTVDASMGSNPLLQQNGNFQPMQQSNAIVSAGPQSNVGQALAGSSPDMSNYNKSQQSYSQGQSNGMSLAKNAKKMMDNPKNSPEQTDAQATQGYADADAQLGTAGVDNPVTVQPAMSADAFEAGYSGSAPMSAEAGYGASAIPTSAPMGATGFGSAGSGAALSGAGSAGAGEGIGAAMPAIGEGIASAAPEIGAGIASVGEGIAAAAPEVLAGIGEVAADVAPLIALAARGGLVPALVSPGERYLKPDQARKVASGKANPMREGKKVPGKPRVAGAKNDYKNDTVKANLDIGGVVLPRSITMSKDAEKKAIEFVRAVLAKGGRGLRK